LPVPVYTAWWTEARMCNQFISVQCVTAKQPGFILHSCRLLFQYLTYCATMPHTLLPYWLNSEFHFKMNWSQYKVMRQWLNKPFGKWDKTWAGCCWLSLLYLGHNCCYWCCCSTLQLVFRLYCWQTTLCRTSSTYLATDHISWPSKAVCLLCACVCVCVPHWYRNSHAIWDHSELPVRLPPDRGDIPAFIPAKSSWYSI